MLATEYPQKWMKYQHMRAEEAFGDLAAEIFQREKLDSNSTSN